VYRALPLKWIKHDPYPDLSTALPLSGKAFKTETQPWMCIVH
jgi:hypothetical protein